MVQRQYLSSLREITMLTGNIQIKEKPFRRSERNRVFEILKRILNKYRP